jgi:hypothetical protein
MLIQPTLDTLNRLKLHGMAHALAEQTTTNAAQGLAFEERLALLLEREEITRDNRRMTRLLQLATLKYRDAVIEDLDYRSRTGLDRSQLASLTILRVDPLEPERVDPRRHRQRQDLPRVCARASGVPPGTERVVRARPAPVRGV